ncbi:MAG: hypothetical protein ACXADY_12220 [Candidatus Hodarchaeales archaeon]|jgi:hypothetical protein
MKVKCQASCRKCYHEKGRTQEFDSNDIIWFCNSCKQNFLCDIGLARGYDQKGKVVFSCSICGRPLVEEEVDKSIIAKKSVQGGRTEMGDLYNKLMAKKGKKKKRRFGKSPTEITLTAFERSQISEICDVKGLTVNLILEFVSDFKIKKSKSNLEIDELLYRLAQEDPAIIPFLYASLVKLDSDPRSFEFRFATFCSSRIHGKSKIVISRQTSDEQCNFKMIEPSGSETWIYCLEKDMDIDNLEKLAARVFNVDFKEFPNLKRVFLAAKSFSYLAKGLLSKYQAILTGIDTPSNESSKKLLQSIPLLLWQPIPGKTDFQNVSLK